MKEYPEGIRPDVLNYDDLSTIAPILKGHHKLVNWMIEWIGLDRVNAIHRRYADTPGIPFATRMVEDEFHFTLRVDNEDILDRFPGGPFITVSNHPFGAMDGIILLHLVGKHRKDYKMMVNMFLNHITAMRPSFIAVDPQKSDDPEKKMVTMQGIRNAMRHVKEGHPLGFFPAGAVSKVDRSLHISDRPWQPTIIKLISQMKVPVIPIFFHGHNSTFFNILGVIDWRLRTLRLPRELFKMEGNEIHISIGEPIMPAEIASYTDIDSLGKMLREKTYELKNLK